MLDFHLHLARLPQAPQLANALKEIQYKNNCIACEPWEWEQATILNPESLTYGIHPMIASQISNVEFEKLETYFAKNKNASVGECGLDKRYPGYSEGEIQEKVFLKQISLAKKYKRDIQIHCVGDYNRIVKLLKQENYPTLSLKEKIKPIFHRFCGDLKIVKETAPWGTLFSLHADSFRKKSTALAILQIQESNIRFETDADETSFKSNNIKDIRESLCTQLASVQQAWNSIKV